MQTKKQLNDALNDLPVKNAGRSNEDFQKIFDSAMLSMYSETKEFIDWYGLSGIVGCLSDLAAENMFILGRENVDFECDTLRDQTQLMFGLIKYMTGLNHHVKNIEYFRAANPAKPS